MNFPFELFETSKIKKIDKKALELVKPLENKAFEDFDKKNVQIAYNNLLEHQISYKNQGVILKNPTPVQIGWENEFEVEQKSVLNYDIFLAHREEILARKELTHRLWLMMKAA